MSSEKDLDRSQAFLERSIIFNKIQKVEHQYKVESISSAITLFGLIVWFGFNKSFFLFGFIIFLVFIFWRRMKYLEKKFNRLENKYYEVSLKKGK